MFHMPWLPMRNHSGTANRLPSVKRKIETARRSDDHRSRRTGLPSSILCRNPQRRRLLRAIIIQAAQSVAQGPFLKRNLPVFGRKNGVEAARGYVDPSGLARLYITRTVPAKCPCGAGKIAGTLAVTHHGRIEIVNAICRAVFLGI